MRKSYKVVRVMPDGSRKIMNTVGSRGELTYLSFHKEFNGRRIETSKERFTLAQEIASGWKRVGPWPQATFVVEEMA